MAETAEAIAAGAKETSRLEPVVAYFSMEVNLESGMPTYSGGLGVLAGDTIRSAADLKVPMVAITLLHRRGYFHQRLDPSGWQTEEPVDWVVGDFLRQLPDGVSVTIEGRALGPDVLLERCQQPVGAGMADHLEGPPRPGDFTRLELRSIAQLRVAARGLDPLDERGDSASRTSGLMSDAP